MNEPGAEFRRATSARHADHAPWPLGLRALCVLCCLSVLIGAMQIAAVATVAREQWGGSPVQSAYWIAAWLLAVTAVVAAALSYRTTFGFACLIGATLHIVVTSYFNLGILISGTPQGVAAQIGSPVAWNLDTLVFFWNWAAIAINAAVCYYVLRYEWPRWARGGPPEERGFFVEAASQDRAE